MSTTGTPSKYVSDEYLRPGHGFCPGCGVALALRYFLKGVGDKIIFANPPGCTGPGIVNSLEYRGEPIETVNTPFGSVAAFAGGIKSGLIAKGDEETLVVAWAGDGATFDIGLGGLSAAAERNEDILYVCADNEGYQNTGNQRSSASPKNTVNTTNPAGTSKKEFKKDIMAIILAHGVPYAATASVGFPDDLIRKARKAKTMKGFRFLHVFCPCPSGWGFPSRLTIELARSALHTRIFPLYEVEDGTRITINRKPKGTPIAEYIKPQKRYGQFTTEDLSELQARCDWVWKRLQYMAALEEGASMGGSQGV